jgi:hypothetical protein
MLITGLEWEDFVVFAEEDMLIQDIYKDRCLHLMLDFIHGYA